MKLKFNENWTFQKAGEEEKHIVCLPHDAMLCEERKPENPSGSAGAYFGGGSYVYTKSFDVPLEWKEKHLVFEFEGIYQTAEIYLNEVRAGEVFYGYGVTEVDADPYLHYGEQNELRVVVDNSRQPNSRWYSGAGIYRPVSLHIMEPEGIALHGVKIRTLSYAPAVIEVEVTAGEGTPVVTILDKESVIAEKEGSKVEIEIPDANLWSADHPYLYQCKVTLKKGEKTVDERTETFGIRKLEWSAKGLLVNGEETLLRGGCIHHDNGVLGACGYEEAEWRRVRIMKENGFNAIRSSHNPCTKAMLEACDALGMYMMDETWDMWYRHKTKYDYAEWFEAHYKEDLASMVEKDYNHPSVIFYSIGNEVSEPADEKGLALEKEMVDFLHEMDDSRAVTAGFNLMIISNAAQGKQMYDGEGGLNADTARAEDAPPTPDMGQMDSTMFNMIATQMGSGMNHFADSDEADQAITPGADLLDIAGYNYASGRYPLDGEKHPERVIFGSETLPPDIYHNWQMVEQYPYLIGDFMWTGWDYLGEAGIGGWSTHPGAMAFDKPYPWLLGGGGVISILGDPDGEALYAKVVWGLEKGPKLAVRPLTMPQDKIFKSAWRGTNAFAAWSYRGYEGEPAVVEVYGDGAEAELFVNDSSVGRKKLEEKKALFETIYEEGTLRAVMYDESGNELGSDSLTSAAGEVQIRIEPEGDAVAGRLLYVNIDLCGENGVIERAQDELLKVEVSGGTLLGFGSADPRPVENFVDGAYRTWYGRSQAVIAVQDEEQLSIKVTGEHGAAEKKITVVG